MISDTEVCISPKPIGQHWLQIVSDYDFLVTNRISVIIS